MGRAPCSRVSEAGLNKGPWTEEEDAILAAFIKANGEGNWRTLPKQAGLQRCRKSCRLRWMNYLRPDLKRGNFSSDEDELIFKLHSLLGNRWSMIAGRIPGRTDNEIKNYWNSRLRRKLKSMEGDLRQLIEATPLTLDLPNEAELGEPFSSTQLDIPAPTSDLARDVSSEARTLVASFPDYGDVLDSSNFPEYARFQANTSDEATSSEPSSDGTCFEECEYHSLEAGYYSAWTPGLEYEVAEDIIRANSVTSESYAYSPESVLFLPQGDSEDDFLSTDFASFTAGLSDLGETNFHKLLQRGPLSPLQKTLVTLSWPAFYTDDSRNSFPWCQQPTVERLEPHELLRS